MKSIENNKRILGVPLNFYLGKKIKEINIDITKYKLFNVLLIIVLNLFLAVTMLYYLSVICNALLICIAVFTITICLTWSILAYRKGSFKSHYIIYENAIVKDFDNSKNVGVYSDFKGYKVVHTFLDRIGKTKTTTLILRFNNPWCSKIILSCITDDIDSVVDTIHNLRLKSKDKYKRNTPTYKSIIKKIIAISKSKNFSKINLIKNKQ